ncbi:MAG: spore germination protein [Limnochordia bacterium]
MSINRKRLSQAYGNSGDVIIRELRVGPRKIRILLVLIEGMVDKALISETVMKPLADHGKNWKSPQQAFKELSGRSTAKCGGQGDEDPAKTSSRMSPEGDAAS